MKTLILTFLLTLTAASFAQTVDYAQVITPDSVAPASFEDRLVRLAWQNYPLNRNFDAEVEISKERVKEQKKGWLDPVTLQLNYGEPHINTSFNADFFPRYNLSVSMNLGKVLSTPQRIKQAEQEQKIAEANKDAQKLRIRAEVVSRYQTYLTNLELLKLRIKSQEDAYSTYLDLTKQFQNGSVSLEIFTQSALAYNHATEEKIKAEGEVAISKARIEELIGVKLEEVL
ncbi:MAG: TolC family protein [Bacteroidia bacterium]